MYYTNRGLRPQRTSLPAIICPHLRRFPSFQPTGSQLLTISLTNYLILSGLTDSRKMDEQEYLDREDHFVSIQRNTHCTP